MEQELKKYRARIFGEVYAIVSDEPEDIILEAVKIIDNSMREIADKSQNLDAKKIAVLTALKIAVRALSIESAFKQEKQLSSRIMNVLDSSEETAL